MNSRKQNVPLQEDSEPVSVNAVPTPAPAPVSMRDPRTDSEDLIRSAHQVLVHYLPGAPLPLELLKVRAMLDAHMFGRDKRTQRDDVVRVARQIDSWRASRSDEPGTAAPRRLKAK